MAGPRKFKVSEMVDAIERGYTALGASKIIGCAPDTVRAYAKKYPAVAEALKGVREETVDIAEMSLRQCILDGEGWAISMTLRTLGRDRGYAERVEARHEITGKDGGPVRIVQIPPKMDIAEWEAAYQENPHK